MTRGRMRKLEKFVLTEVSFNILVIEMSRPRSFDENENIF